MDKNSSALGPQSYILGLQHLFAMFGATILVPLLTGLNASVALFSAGIGTLIFHLVTKGKVPVFLGSSFAFIAGIAAVVSKYGIAEAGGGIIAAGAVYLIIALLVYFLGVEKIRTFVPPVVTGPIIIVIGLMLCPVAVRNITMAPGESGLEVLSGTPLLVNWLIALFVIVVIVTVMIFVKGFFKLVPILFGILSGYILCLIIDAIGIDGVPTLINTQVVVSADWFNFKSIFAGTFFTLPKFNWTAIGLIAPIAIVTFMEHIGDITTSGAVVGKDFFKDPGLHRTLIGDGLATIFAGLVGGPANTTYSENTGVLAVTKVYDPRILRIAAIFAIILSLVGKFGAVLQTIPLAVMGGVSMTLFGMISSIGMRTITEAKLDFTYSRNLVIVALILTIGIGVSVWNGAAGGGIQIGDTVNLSGLFVAALVGIIANKVLPEEL
jgi:uracil permease